jgi:ribosome-associated toxin RatA of RatAB toxin-antitoxin module
MFLTTPLAATGGRPSARRCFASTALLVLAISSATIARTADPTPVVREEHGVYVVSAEFNTVGTGAAALAALTDYENIPRFMPAVRSSKVIERGDGYSVVEQEAMATFMLFSRRVHLMLEVREHSGTVRFIDRCGQSFERYEGAWTISERDGRTTISYELEAKPSFDVPGFVLKRLMKRDARQMIGHLQREIAAR